ncbi:hypothetical protein Tco_0822918 [Tanacetum coccineum]|uniref:Uncharacterized protein n=1 Tax=Tanacetum coccineum TaxID=301880 RepID=A0ABQ5ALC0_9ASTR
MIQKSTILKPLSKMTESNKKQYFSDIRVMSYLLQGIPSDIYNSVDAYKDAKIMWEMIKRLMHGCDKTEQVRHSRLMDEFDKFVAMEGESLTSMYESKYVTMTRQSQNLHSNDFDHLYDAFSQYEPHVNASKAKKDARNHDPLALGTNAVDIKDEAGGTLNGEENDFMLDNAYGNDTLEELTDAIIMMAHIQPTNDNGNAEPKYDVDANHAKLNTVNTSDDDQIDSNNISDDPYVENNEAKNQQTINNELKKQKALLQKELEMCKEQIENEKAILKHETELAKKSFKQRENKYLDDIVDLEDIMDLEEKLSSHDQIVYKMSPINSNNSYAWEKPNKVYDPFLKVGLGYQNPEHLKKVIAAQPKMYDGERIQSAKLKIDSPDYEETLEDAEESRLKMNDKMIQLDYEN